MGSRVVYEGSSYIYSPSKIAVPQNNGSRLENGIKVCPADVSLGSWVLSIVLRDKVWCLDIGDHLPRVMFSAKTLLLN